MMQKYFGATKKYYYGLFFIIPFLIVYEIGLFQGVLGENINGADALVRFFFYFIFQMIGIELARILFAGLIVGAIVFLIFLIFRHHAKIKIHYFFFMLFECAALALVVGVIVHVLLSLRFPKFFTFQPNPSVVAQLAIAGIRDVWAKIVASIGAGVFEEFVFRVLLIHAFYAFWKRGIYKHFGADTTAMVKSSFFSSIIFTLMHIGSVSSMFGLIPIFIGSLIFSFIYLSRGYGIAAGTHILYDMYLMFGVLA